MHVDSPAFVQQMPIPKKFTCEGEDVSPELNIHEIPKGTKSLALIMDDPDAPVGLFTHWVAWNIPPTTSRLEEGVKLQFEGKNDFPKIGYGGPCPPPGKVHRYYFHLYALDTTLNLPVGIKREQLLKAMEKHIIQQTELMGTYKR